MTGVTLYQFGYNSAGLLVSVTDRDGNVTTIERDANGKATGIVGPYGQRTGLTVSANGYLTSVANPAGEAYHFTSTVDGLLTTFTDPNCQAMSLYSYHVHALNPAGESPASSPVDVITPTFDDVLPGSIYWPPVEALVRERISTGCQANPPLYCPERPVTRGQMAVFLCRAFGISTI